LREELVGRRSSRERIFRPPSIQWIRARLGGLRELLERNTRRSPLLLPDFLGPIRLEPVQADIGRPYYQAVTAIDPLALIEAPLDPEGPGGSNTLRWWRRRIHSRGRG
jgi:hypothetical protein